MSGYHQNYHSVGGYDEALQHNKSGSKKSKYIVIGSVVTLLVLIGVGVGVGVTVAKNNSKNQNAATTGGKGSGNSTSSNGPKQTDPNDPSTFVKDPNLHKSFYGMAYTPEGSQVNEGCHNTLDNVIKDIQLMSQLTTRIRLYGADCNQSALVLEAIRQTKVDMQVYLGNYVVPEDTAPYIRQRDVLKQALQTYGADHVAGITVGNEFMLNYVIGQKANDANDAIADVGAQILVDNIADTRSMVAGLNLGKTIQVGNSDAGSFFSNKVLAVSDYGLSNVHPWFANVTAADASAWTTSFFQETNVVPASQLPNKPRMYLAETGWPTGSKDLANLHNGPGEASIAGLQTFIDSFVCQANAANTGYFFFEFFDEDWKDRQFGGVEGHWGLFYANRTLKAITIPDCASP